MKNILTDSEIIERKIASLTPEQIARWQTPAIGLYSIEIREEIKKQWIREYYQGQEIEGDSDNEINVNELNANARDAQTGLEIAKMLCLKQDENYTDRYETEFGSKTALGIFRTVKRIIEERSK